MAWYHVPYVLHPLAGSDWRTFWRMYRDHAPYAGRSRLSLHVAILSLSLRGVVDAL